MKLIYADALRETIRQWYWDTDIQKVSEDPCVVDAMISLFIHTIIDAPSVDAKPVRYAQNISECNPVDEFICSNCGLIMRDFDQIHIDVDDEYEYCCEFEFSYCPKCGYKITEEG